MIYQGFTSEVNKVKNVCVCFTRIGLQPPPLLLLEHPGLPTSGPQLSNSLLPTVPEWLKELHLHIHRKTSIKWKALFSLY